MATKRDKKVAEISRIKNLLPDTDFTIKISDNNASMELSSYGGANLIIKMLSPDDAPEGILNQLDSKYLFAAYFTNKSLAKKLKIKVTSNIFQNYK